MNPLTVGSAAPLRISLERAGRHALCLLVPAITCGVLALRPTQSLQLALIAALLCAIETFELSGRDHSAAPEQAVSWPFDTILYLSFLIVVTDLVLFCRLIADHGLFSFAGFVALLAMRASSEIGIIVAHELIHRAPAHLQLMGRLLLCSVGYEHFYTEHVRGHHALVATSDDPATARYGETFWRFLPRSMSGQLESALRLEQRRLAGRKLLPRVLHNRVLQGFAAELTLLGAVFASCGGQAALALLLQGAGAVLSLELLNYVEHWGLSRSGRRASLEDSWDSECGYSLYQLLALPRHADHHAVASRPYYRLRPHSESPKLPFGYRRTFRMVLFDNQRLIALMSAELERRRLGPFAPGQPVAQEAPAS
jgi:alkane 1-monooxygenase